MPKLYVSYRRQDSAAHAGRLIDALEHRLGQGGVLRPERLITSGEDWGLAQHRILRSCTLMLVHSNSDAPLAYGLYVLMQSSAGRGPGAALGVIAVILVAICTFMSHLVIEQSQRARGAVQ